MLRTSIVAACLLLATGFAAPVDPVDPTGRPAYQILPGMSDLATAVSNLQSIGSSLYSASPAEANGVLQQLGATTDIVNRAASDIEASWGVNVVSATLYIPVAMSLSAAAKSISDAIDVKKDYLNPQPTRLLLDGAYSSMNHLSSAFIYKLPLLDILVNIFTTGPILFFDNSRKKFATVNAANIQPDPSSPSSPTYQAYPAPPSSGNSPAYQAPSSDQHAPIYPNNPAYHSPPPGYAGFTYSSTSGGYVSNTYPYDSFVPVQPVST